MQPALSNFVNSMNMPTNPTCLVKSFRCKMSLGGVFGTTIPTQGTIVNTFNVEWWLLKTDCVVKTSDGLVIGEWINGMKIFHLIYSFQIYQITLFMFLLVQQFKRPF